MNNREMVNVTKKKGSKEPKKSDKNAPRVDETSEDCIKEIVNLCTEQQFDLLLRMNDVIGEQQKFNTNIWEMWSKFNDNLYQSILPDFGKEQYKQISGIWNEQFRKMNAFLIENTQKNTGKYTELLENWKTIAEIIGKIASSSGNDQTELIENLKNKYEEVTRYTNAFFAENNEGSIEEFRDVQSSWLDFTNKMNALLIDITTDENAYKMMAEGGMHQMFAPSKSEEVLVNWNKISSEINNEMAGLISETTDKFKVSQEEWNEFLQKLMKAVAEENWK